jgi:hypothetical protein
MTIEPTGTWGIKYVKWSTVKRALENLGGYIVGTTGRHNAEVFKMPSGYKFVTSGAHRHRNDLGGNELKRILGCALEAGFTPQRFMKELEKAGDVVMHKTPAKEQEQEEPVTEVQQQTKPIRETHQHSLGSAIALTAPTGSPQYRQALRQFKKQREAERGLIAQLQNTGDLIYNPDLEPGPSNYYLNDKAFEAVAEWVDKYFGDAEQEAEPQVEQEEQEAPEGARLPVATVVYVEPENVELLRNYLKQQGQEDVWVRPLPSYERATIDAPHLMYDAPAIAAILKMCERGGVMPALNGLQVDLNATVVKLAEELPVDDG